MTGLWVNYLLYNLWDYTMIKTQYYKNQNHSKAKTRSDWIWKVSTCEAVVWAYQFNIAPK